MSACAQLGAEIRRQREGAGYSAEVFAAKVGMTPQRYAAFEQGEGTVFLSTLERIAQGLGIRVSELLHRAGL